MHLNHGYLVYWCHRGKGCPETVLRDEYEVFVPSLPLCSVLITGRGRLRWKVCVEVLERSCPRMWRTARQASVYRTVTATSSWSPPSKSRQTPRVSEGQQVQSRFASPTAPPAHSPTSLHGVATFLPSPHQLLRSLNNAQHAFPEGQQLRRPTQRPQVQLPQCALSPRLCIRQTLTAHRHTNDIPDQGRC